MSDERFQLYMIESGTAQGGRQLQAGGPVNVGAADAVRLMGERRALLRPSSQLDELKRAVDAHLVCVAESMRRVAADGVGVRVPDLAR